MNNKYIKKFEIPQSLSLLRNDDIQPAAKCAAAAHRHGVIVMHSPPPLMTCQKSGSFRAQRGISNN